MACLERDVVVEGAGHGTYSGRGGCCGCLGTVGSGGHEFDLVYDDLDLGALLALVGLPLAPTELALDSNLAALGEEAGNALGAGAEHRAVDEVRVVLPFARLRVLAAVVHCDAEAHHRVAGSGGAKLGVAGEVARYDNAVDGHDVLRSLVGGDSFRSPLTDDSIISHPNGVVGS